MAEYQVTSWRELPSLVIAREGDQVAKVPLPQRFQEAIDEAAMRLGDVSSDAYLSGWEQGPWTPGDGAPSELAAAVAAGLEQRWPADAVTAFLGGLAPGGS
ncbi:MAG: virulence factor [Candidatus Limnocylindrales bacterium]